MASLISRPNSNFWIQFKYRGRQTLRLGKCTLHAATEAKEQIEVMVERRKIGAAVPTDCIIWLRGISNKWRKRLSSIGLLEHAESPETLGALIRYCREQYLTAKPNTRRNMNRMCELLEERFGLNAPIDSITPGDCKEFRRWLEFTKSFAPTTRDETCKKAKQLFAMARDKGWIATNPFQKMKKWVRTNPERRVFVERETIDLIMEVCEPDWKLIIALVRYGGLRCPSEVTRMKWSYINWDERRFTVMTPKKEHNPEQKYRACPIFPELAPHLEQAWDRAEPGAIYLLPQYQEKGDKTLYSAFLKRINRAGVTPWESLFVNLRSSRETELAREYPLHNVVAWLGHSEHIAQLHYLQVMEEDFRRAAGVESPPKTPTKKRSRKAK